MLFWQHTAFDAHAFPPPRPTAEMGEHPSPSCAVTPWRSTPSRESSAEPAAESDWWIIRRCQRKWEADSEMREGGRTLSMLLQHCTGPVLQLPVPVWSAAAKTAKERAERTVRRANMVE